MSGGYVSRSASTIGNPYTFTGRRLDSLDPDGSGGYQLNLMYYRARTYDPQTGRFMQRDPAEYQESMNLFEYVKSNPIINFDPTGMLSECACKDRWGAVKVGKHQHTRRIWRSNPKLTCAVVGQTLLDDIFNWNTLIQLILEYIQKYGGGPGSPIGGIATSDELGKAVLLIELDEHEQIIHRPCCNIKDTDISDDYRTARDLLAHPDHKLWHGIVMKNGIIADQKSAEAQCDKIKAYYRGRLKYKPYERECLLNASSDHSFGDIPSFYY
jgi:RHS repeat-associated protein